MADELITTRAGVRVRIGNTDAEGRNVMSDPLCRAKEWVSCAIKRSTHTGEVVTVSQFDRVWTFCKLECVYSAVKVVVGLFSKLPFAPLIVLCLFKCTAAVATPLIKELHYSQ